VCALVDASDSFDPASAAAAGIDLDRLLWVRCQSQVNALKHKGAGMKPRSSTNAGFAFGGVLEQVLKVTDLLLQGGFGMVVLDLGDIPVESARRVPLTSWFRFRRAVEPTATVLLMIEQEPCAKTCASLVLRLQPEAIFISNSSTSSNLPELELEFSSCTTGPDGSEGQAPARHSSPSSRTEFFPEEHAGSGCITGLYQGTAFSRAAKPAGIQGFSPCRETLEQSQPGYETAFSKTWESRENYLPSVPKNNVVGHAALFRGMRFHAQVVRSWAQRKPPQSAGVNFELRSAS
jgi:hypothetical protein